MHDQVAKVETSISGRGKLFWAVAILVSVGIMVGVAVGVALPGALEAQNEPGQDVSSATRVDQNGATVSIGAFNPASTSRPGTSYTGEVDDTPSGASAVSAQGSAPGIPDKPTGTAIFIGGVDLEWNDVPGADFYDVQLFRNEQWMDLPGNGVEIAFYGAGAIVSELDPGSSYTFHVRAGNAGGSSDWSDYLLMSSTNQSVSGRRARPANLAASGAVVVNGIPQISRVLTADATGISDGNGLDRVQFRFQWVSNDGSTDADIASATGSSYTLSANDEGRTIKVRVAFTDRGGYAESLTSSATAAVGLLSNIEATGAPTITGTAQVGNTLTADTSSIADADGLANVSYSYQWIANDGTSDTEIQNATGSSYTLAAADEGKTIKVRVSFTDDAANDETLTSAATVVVAAQSLDAETARYEITFTGLFDAEALGVDVDVPRNANFRKLVGSLHDQNISYWSEGASASEGLKILAEHGRTDSFEDEIAGSVSDGRALRSFETTERRLGPTAEEKLQFTTTRDFPLVTLAAKINPTPDWFIAIGALSLRPDGEWEREIVVDLYPWDAGTQDGTEFERHTPATNPPGVITTLRNTGKFSDSPIARVAFTLLVPPQVRDVTADTGDGQIEMAWTKVDRAAGYKVQWKSGSEGFGDAATTGREHVIEDGESDGYTISNLTNGAEYTVRVIATNPAGDGEPSVEVTATPLDPAADDVLVSNIHQNPALSAQLPVSVSDPRYLQGFTTGAGATTVESITLPDLSSVETNAAVTLSLYSDVGGAPGTLLHTLTPPATFSTGVDATFTPPAGAIITLAANTSHFIQIDHSAGSLAMSFTKADAEDPDSDPGWSLANDCQTRSSTDTVYSTCLFSKALRVSIQGPPAVSAPALSISDASATEGSSVELTVVMSKPAADSVTVQYSTRDGTATGTDYTAAAGATLTFAPGETEQTISIATTDDTADEDDEDFTVTLSNPSENAALGASYSATGTIVNNDETTLTDATLSALTLTDNNGAAIGLTPAFARYSFVYSASVANDIDSLTATATKNSNGASVVFVGADDTSTPGEAGYELEVGNNLVKAMVTSPDANRVKIYMVNVARAASDDATLVSLSLADANATVIALNPATFDADTTEYTASVAGDIDSATVTVAANHSGASVLIITADGSEAAKSATVDLPPGDTFIKVMVTAENGQTSKIYSVFVTRQASGQESDATLSSYSLAGSDAAELLVAPSFNPEFGSYYAYVENDIASVTVTAIANRPEATMVFLDGQRTGTPGQVSRNLAVGSTRVKVVVTAEDGITQKIYQIFVLRAPSDAATDSSLSELTLTDSAGTTIDLNPATFDPTTTAYTASVGNEVNAVEVITLATDSNAEPFIIGTDARISIEQGSVELAVGENLIKVTVYAEDHAATTTYNVTVTRAASDDSGDATLSSLTLSDGVGTDIGLTPIFDPGTIGYTASVANEIASVTLTAAKNNTGASVAIIEADGTSTPDSATVDLDVGRNLIKAMVTSQDGLVSMIYSVIVSRAASNDATLSSLTLVDSNGSGVLVTPTFQASEGVYTALVANGVDSVTATATLNDGDASMIFIGDTDTSTPAEITQDLAVGSNLVKAMVTAEDGATTKVYMVTVTRPAANAATDAALRALTLVDDGDASVDLSPPFDPETTSYTATVASSVHQITASATAEHSGAWPLIFSEDGRNKRGAKSSDLSVGGNLVKVMVTAEDGATTKIYMVTVTRADPSSTDDATLSSLTLENSDGASIGLTPAFAPATAAYAATVGYAVDSVTLTAARNHGGASASVIQEDGTTTVDKATVALAVGDNLIKVMVTAEDGLTVLIYQVTVTRAEAWSATLTVGTNTAYVPATTGYSLWGTNIGSVSSQSFRLDGRTHRVLTIMRLAGGLYLNISRELPVDFTLTIGTLEFLASDSSQPASAAAGRYWWEAGNLDWADGDTLEVSITPTGDGSDALAARPQAPPSVYFTSIPANHNGVDPFTFRLRFTDEAPMSFRKLRDEALEVTNGTSTKAQRTKQGSNLHWNITVQPDSSDPVTIALPATSDCAAEGAICTSDGRKLSNSVEFTVPGPATSQ